MEIATLDRTTVDVYPSYYYTIDSDNHFRLDPEFIRQYKNKKPNFGFNGMGEFVYYRTYSRIKDNGTKEDFVDTLTRVTEGCYEIQRRHCFKQHIQWDYDKAQESAQEMFQRMWDFKFLPPGRGLWMMGTDCMWKSGSAALQNCAFTSTGADIEKDPVEPYCFMLDMSMLGVGVGFDTLGADITQVHQPSEPSYTYLIDDSREGWVDSTRKVLRSFLRPGNRAVILDYSSIRPAGTPIKGFGGVAAGPDILRELHELLSEHLTRRIGQVLTSVDITDLMNYIGRCVVAGNVRRSSQLALAKSGDAAYSSMKNPTATLLPEEVSAFYSCTAKVYAERRSRASVEDFAESGIPHERLLPAISTFNALNFHRWASNNSLLAKVGQDYSKVSEQIAANGEPGLIWLDNMRDYGRTIDGRQPGVDGRVRGTNPCFSGEMKLFTENGYKTLRELWVKSGCQEYQGQLAGAGSAVLDDYGTMKVVNRHGLVEATNVYRTSEKSDLFRVKFNDGSFIDATSNHSFVVLAKRGRKISEVRKHLSQLQVGDRIPNTRVSHFGQFSDPTYAELAGWCIGDGGLSQKADGQIRGVCNCYESDMDNVMPRLQQLMLRLYEAHNQSSNQSPTYTPWDREQEFFDHDQSVIGSNVLGRLLKSDGVIPGSKHSIPTSVYEGDKPTVAAFIRGLASADGGVLPGNKGRIAVSISQSNESLLLETKLLLSQFGIYSTVAKSRNAGRVLMNDGKGGKKWYNRKPSYRLLITGIKQVRQFLNEIGFIQNWKNEIGLTWLDNHKGSNNSDTGKYVSIESIEYVGEGETFCLTEPGSNLVSVAGHEVGQCAEQSLESGELCNLCETFPANHDSADDYMRTLKFAYLYAKTVTLLPTHNSKANRIMLRNRRIGLSQSGIAQAISKFGLSALIHDFCDAGYHEIRRWDNIYSEWLCINKSNKVTSIKPSGSVSLLAGATPGIHFPEASTYWRRIRIAKDNVLVRILERAGYHVEPSLTDPATAILKFAVSDPSVRPVSKVSIWEQTTLVSLYQTYWADNQVSVTIKFKASEAEDIPRVIAANDHVLKSISFLPQSDHGYQQAPYEACSAQEVEEYNGKIGVVDYSDYIYEAAGSLFCDGDNCQIG